MKGIKHDDRPSGKFTSWKKSIANKLNEWINPLSAQIKMNGFLVIGVFMGTICFVLVLQSIHSNEISEGLSIDSIATPKEIFHSDYNSENEVIEAYNQMIQYKELVDKLKTHPHLLDSLERVRPGLRDSVRSFTENYFSH